MVLVLFFALFFLLGCTQAERDNPLDSDGVNYVGAVGESSSSSEIPSSSSIDGSSSSSEMPSSSSVEDNSSSSEGSSSSIVPLPKYTLEISVDPAEGGSVSLDPELELYEQGTVVTVKATAEEGYAFVGWSGALESESKEWYIIMNDNKTLTANFKLIPPNSYSLEIHVNDVHGGTVHHSPSGAIHVSGTVVTVTAEPEFGYEFTGWSGNATSTENPIEITMDEHKALTANFAALLSGTFTDSRDGQEYGWVRIGTQVWMAENLNYAVNGSLCYGDNTGNDNQNRCGTYGRLYNWATAMNLNSSCNTSTCASQVQTKHRGICPSGWHLPSDAEWTALTTAVGSNPGAKLKATSGWNINGNGTDDFGFSALPGGYGRSGGSFHDVVVGGYWWSSSEYSSDNAYRRYIFYGYSSVDRNYSLKTFLFSVRCLQD